MPDLTANVVITAHVGGALVTGDGMSPGSVFTVPAPSLLCMLGSGQWGWDVYLMFPGSTATQDDVDYFSIACP